MGFLQPQSEMWAALLIHRAKIGLISSRVVVKHSVFFLIRQQFLLVVICGSERGKTEWRNGCGFQFVTTERNMHGWIIPSDPELDKWKKTDGWIMCGIFGSCWSRCVKQGDIADIYSYSFKLTLLFTHFIQSTAQTFMTLLKMKYSVHSVWCLQKREGCVCVCVCHSFCNFNSRDILTPLTDLVAEVLWSFVDVFER